jgi:hypothetical protein
MDLDEERRRKLAWLRKHQPERYREIIDVVFEVERRAKRAEYERSFLSFVRRAWQEIDVAPLSIAWFHEVLAEHLEAICHGEIRHLIVNQPPRTSKSLFCSVLYPAWVWCRQEVDYQSSAAVKFFCVSYSANLAEEIASKMRRLVLGPWYQGIWSDVRLLPDQSSRANFGNTAGGERISNSIEGGLLGRAGICQIIDDPHSISGAESDAERQTTLRSFAEGLPTRINDPRHAAKILVCQRVHEDDCTNLALETWPPDTVHLCFPARHELNRRCPQDRRTIEGELLWPEVWPEEELRKVELGLAGLEKGQAGLSSYAAQAQLQQSPVPRGGGVIPRTAWKIWPENPLKPEDIKRNRQRRIHGRASASQFCIGLRRYWI